MCFIKIKKNLELILKFKKKKKKNVPCNGIFFSEFKHAVHKTKSIFILPILTYILHYFMHNIAIFLAVQ